MGRVILGWLPLAFAITGLCGLAYAAIQQEYRQSLNDPQIQIVRDAADKLAHGFKPADLVNGSFDASKSLAPFLAVYDEHADPIVSSAIVSGEQPKPPSGVFSAAENNAGKGSLDSYENRVTWQPDPDTRIALVVAYVPETRQFVASGRNMRETEKRIAELGANFAIGWLILIIGSLFCSLLSVFLPKFFFR